MRDWFKRLFAGRSVPGEWADDAYLNYEPLPPHPANVPGSFYVEDGCCLACGVPETVAPDHFDWVEGENHCFVKKQPGSDVEFAAMKEAMGVQEVECIRVKQCPARWAVSLREDGYGHLIDSVAEEHEGG